MKKFLNAKNDNQDKGQIKIENGFLIEFIDIDSIKPSEKNFYKVDDVEELKESISMYGLQQNLVVRKIDSATYELISGERRYTALKALVAEGQEAFKTVPVKVEYNINDIKAELQLIFANSTTRIRSDYEKMQEIKRLKELLQQLKQSGTEIPGRLRNIIADTLEMSTGQVGKLESINNNLSDGLKQEFKDGNINTSTAYEAAKLSQEQQEKLHEKLKEDGSIAIKDAKTLEEDKEVEQAAEDSEVKEEKNDPEAEPQEHKDIKVHKAKIYPEYFEAIISGLKTFEYRKNDREYKVGDILELYEYKADGQQYTGRKVRCEIPYILANSMLPEGYIVMSIKVLI